MLGGATARKLYHEYACDMPIYDFHCHLSPAEIAGNKQYGDITEVWLGGDHYKWRAMRAAGIPERFITGDAAPREKFMKWAEVVPQTIGNPLYHWTHLELSRFFGIDQLLSPQTAPMIWDKCNQLLARDDFRAQALIARSNVRYVATTDDPLDSLEHHAEIARRQKAGELPGFTTVVRPSFRPDRLIHVDKSTFLPWVKRLAAMTPAGIDGFASFQDAIRARIDFFHANNCRAADHGLERIEYVDCDDAAADAIFRKVLRADGAGRLTPEEIRVFKTRMLVFLGKEYAKRGWVMMLHLGTLRDTNLRMFRELGPDTGFDTIADYPYMEGLAQLLGVLDDGDCLPKTMLFNNNPRDNYAIATMIGCFQGGVRGKIQMGSGWWFNDQKDGMVRQMTALASTGLLSTFLGMLTDSRSFLSYTRHEYFRRILCDLVGGWVDRGEAPADMELLGRMVRDICYGNVLAYFGS
ncbi:MAG: glucuronate isomerase [Clostridia bacterium]|nr:glucuronate isomerase [Clostridia bacterium]